MTDPLSIGRSAEIPFAISSDDMKAFAELSGDRNPLHSDAAAAAKAGYDKPIVYGGLLLAKISTLLGMWLPGPGTIWVKINLVFEKPLYVDEPAVLKGMITNISQATHMVEVEHALTRRGDVIARGSSSVKFHMPEAGG